MLATPVPSPAPTATATPTPTPAPPATPTPVPPDAVAIHVAGEAERSHLETGLVEAGFVVADSFVGADGADGADGAERAIADTPLAGAHPFVLARWAAVTDQRRDVLDLGRDDVVRIVRGDAIDWSEFGGSAQSIEVFLPVSQVARIADALGIPAGELAATALPYGALADHVAATPGAFALVEPERLRLGVLALTVDGHDPYRDPAEDSPLRLVRWLRAPTGEDALALAAAAGIAAAPSFDPAGVFVAGELIPVRCSNHVLAQLDDYGAMFDGTREALLAADIAVTSLDSSLTDLGTPTLCIRTFVLQGSPRVVDALSEAGIDVVLTVGNHIADCWGGCSPGGALLDTLTRLHDVGHRDGRRGREPAGRAHARRGGRRHRGGPGAHRLPRVRLARLLERRHGVRAGHGAPGRRQPSARTYKRPSRSRITSSSGRAGATSTPPTQRRFSATWARSRSTPARRSSSEAIRTGHRPSSTSTARSWPTRSAASSSTRTGRSRRHRGW